MQSRTLPFHPHPTPPQPPAFLSQITALVNQNYCLGFFFLVFRSTQYYLWRKNMMNTVGFLEKLKLQEWWKFSIRQSLLNSKILKCGNAYHRDSSTIMLHFTACPLLLLFVLQQCPEALRQGWGPAVPCVVQTPSKVQFARYTDAGWVSLRGSLLYPSLS